MTPQLDAKWIAFKPSIEKSPMFSRGCSCIWDFRNNKCNKGNQPEIGSTQLNITSDPKGLTIYAIEKTEVPLVEFLARKSEAQRGVLWTGVVGPGNTWTKHGLNSSFEPSEVHQFMRFNRRWVQVVSVGHCHNSSLFLRHLSRFMIFLASAAVIFKGP